jgi:lipoprotein-releasing system permease protein
VRQPYQLSIAFRYLRARSRDSFISFISLVSMLGIGLAVAVLMVVLSVMNGFEYELQQKILGMVSDATLTGFEAPIDEWQAARTRILERADVVAAAPLVEGEGMVIYGDAFAGIEVRGIVPSLETEVSAVGDLLVAGDLAALTPGTFNIVIGRGLADLLGIRVGDKLQLALPQARVTPGGFVPRRKVFTVAGIFSAGMYEYDRGVAFIHLADAALLFRTGGKATSMSLKVTDIYAAGTTVMETARALGGGFYASDWSRQHANIFRSIAITKGIMFVLLSLVIAVAAFNIVSTLVMVVREKRGDIAILRSVGTSPRGVMSIFATQGTAIGVVGTTFGLLLGLVVMRFLDTLVAFIESTFGIDLLPEDVYFIAELPTRARFDETLQICALTLLLAVAATIYPALKAAHAPPAEALRYE